MEGLSARAALLFCANVAKDRAKNKKAAPDRERRRSNPARPLSPKIVSGGKPRRKQLSGIASQKSQKNVTCSKIIHNLNQWNRTCCAQSTNIRSFLRGSSRSHAVFARTRQGAIGLAIEVP